MSEQNEKPRYQFLRGLIKSTHPDWTETQIEEQIKKTIANEDGDNGECEHCSS